MFWIIEKIFTTPSFVSWLVNLTGVGYPGRPGVGFGYLYSVTGI